MGVLSLNDLAVDGHKKTTNQPIQSVIFIFQVYIHHANIFYIKDELVLD